MMMTMMMKMKWALDSKVSQCPPHTICYLSTKASSSSSPTSPYIHTYTGLVLGGGGDGEPATDAQGVESNMGEVGGAIVPTQDGLKASYRHTVRFRSHVRTSQVMATELLTSKEKESSSSPPAGGGPASSSSSSSKGMYLYTYNTKGSIYHILSLVLPIYLPI